MGRRGSQFTSHHVSVITSITFSNIVTTAMRRNRACDFITPLGGIFSGKVAVQFYLPEAQRDSVLMTLTIKVSRTYLQFQKK